MDDIAAKRVYAGSEGSTTLVVAASPGLVGVSIAGDRVGEFGLARRCDPADVAAAAGRLAAATDGDVLLADEPAVDALTGTGFGPGAAVSFDGERPVAVSPEGRVGAYGAAGDRGSDGWTVLGEVPAPPAALDGDLVATADGVFRLAADGPVPAGLADVHDVGRVAGVPLAATATGLYELGNGWMDVLDGDVRVVAGTRDGRAHAATPDELFSRGADGWRPVERPTDEPVVALAHGDQALGATAVGDLLVETDAGWRAEPLGLPDVRALTVL